MNENSHPWDTVKHAYQRRMARWCGRRTLRIQPDSALISFSFDDFPRSALLDGGDILSKYDCAGTYYASFGLAGRTELTGEIFSPADLAKLLDQGHELGCHTYDHYDAWGTDPAEFEASILRNRRAAAQAMPGLTLTSLSYPISYPRPETKRRVAKYFGCSRGGGQAFNVGIVDANYLKSFFLEQSRDDFHLIKRTIEAAAQQRGWLIFSTHDISDSPTRYGCTPSFFERVVECATRSGAVVLPVGVAWQRVQRRSNA